MPVDRTYPLLSHLTLALAGVCLTAAEIPYLPEIQFGLVLYLGLLALSWRRGGRRSLPVWATNLCGLAIAAGAVLWVVARISDNDGGWSADAPLPVIIIPFLGPVLMALLLVRLFRPPAPGDFWAFQGLGLLQVGLGCILASGTLFGACLLSYFGVAFCTLAVYERHVQVGRARRRAATGHGIGQTVLGEPPGQHETQRWVGFGLRWALGVGVLVVPLFLLTPRLDGPDWDPLTRFAMQPNRVTSTRMGFSEEINLKRVGVLERDDAPVFTVRVTSPSGGPAPPLPADQRWRGVVLDRYEEGVWRGDASWTDRGAKARPGTRLDESPGVLWLTFRVPRRAGWLFLAEPVRLGPIAGDLPVVPAAPRQKGPPLFYEAAGTVVPLTYFADSDYRYIQAIPAMPDRDRYPVVRLSEAYLRKLLSNPLGEQLGQWSVERVLQLVRQTPAPDKRLLAALERRRDWDADLPPAAWAPVAQLLTHHLAQSGEYSYSLELRRGAVDTDPVLDFLQNVKQGPCERYAAALGLSLRSLGVPARIVKGYRGQEPQGDGMYQVRNSTAHAWVEAVVPGVGETSVYDWLILDPTPASESAPESSTLERLQRSGQALWRDLILGYNAGEQSDLWVALRGVPLAAAAVPCLVGGFGLLLVGLLRWRVSERIPDKKGAAALYARFLVLLERRGQMRPRPDETPAELAQRAAALLLRRPATAALADVPARVVAVYYLLRYGGRPPAEEVLRQAADRLAALAALRRW